MDRFRRGTPTKIRLGERDFRMFKLLATHRALNSSHLASFLGVEPSKYFLKRLKDLYDNSYVDRIENYDNALSKTGTDKLIYALSDKGAGELQKSGEKISARGRSKLNNRIKASSLKHDLLVMDFLTALFEVEDQKTRLILPGEILERSRAEQKAKRQQLSMSVAFEYLGEYTHKGLIPDGLFGIEVGNTQKYYFLEIDTGTENQTRSTPKLESILRKMKGYTNIYKDKIAEESFNIDNFKVLFVTTTDKRIDYMIENVFDEYIAGDIPRNIFLFSTFEKTKNNTAGDKVWRDCRGNNVSFFK